MRASVVGGILSASLIAACFIHRPSEDLECATTTDCADLGANRMCVDGFCVVPNCPAGCTACDEVARTCMVTCTNSDKCGSNFRCPAGWNCTVSCTGDGACQDVTCDSGSRCSVTCSGSNACMDVDCDAACQCDLACASGACDAVSCPTRGNGANQVHCTQDGTTASPCDSGHAPSCTSC